MGHSNGAEEIHACLCAKMKWFCRDFADMFISCKQYLGNRNRKVCFKYLILFSFSPFFSYFCMI